MAKTRTGETPASTGDGGSKSPEQQEAVVYDDIARRAYDLYLARRCEHGHDVDDWLQAERELRGPSVPA